jgi:hypothetical protein
MNFDAPTLQRVDWAVSPEGTAVQFQLATTAETLDFQVSYRQVAYVLDPIRRAAAEMRNRLLGSKQPRRGKILDALVGVYAVKNPAAATAPEGGLRLTLETEGGGQITLLLQDEAVETLRAALDAPT